jgi:hypothetical protein
MITLLVAGLLLIGIGAGGASARADDGCCGCTGARGGLFSHAEFVPNVTYYAPYPYWWPNYFGPPYTDYQVVQYVSPPAATALIVKERIAAINAANPALLLPLPGEALPSPKSGKQEPGKPQPK